MSNNLFPETNYLIRRKVLELVGGSFRIYDPNGQLVFFSKMKAFKLREDIRIFTGEDMQEEVLAIKARQIIDFSAAYDVFDPRANEKVGALKRKGWKSMLLDEWILMDAGDQEIGLIKEASLGMALLSRFINLIPQKYHGIIGDTVVCTFKQNFNPFVMKISVDFTPDQAGLLDRRLGMAAALLLCAIEGKQS
jgi:uncharacterized protein YxjI